MQGPHSAAGGVLLDVWAIWRESRAACSMYVLCYTCCALRNAAAIARIATTSLASPHFKCRHFAAARLLLPHFGPLLLTLQPLPATTMVVCNAGLNMVPANRLLTGLTGRRVRVYKAGASPSPFRRVGEALGRCWVAGRGSALALTYTPPWASERNACWPLPSKRHRRRRRRLQVQC